MVRKIDVLWKKFWKLTILQDAISKNKINRYVNCICDCWSTKIIRLSHITSWNTNSCWCIAKEKSSYRAKNKKTHWMTWTKIYNVWKWILQRCWYKKHKNYNRYWWRWILCERKTFKDFFKDMGSWYIEWLTIDRINNNWNYCKQNCRRATMKEQANNKN